MTARRLAAPRGPILRLEVAAPPELTEDQIRTLIEEALGSAAKAGPKKVAPLKGPKPKRMVLRNREVRHRALYPCRREPTTLAAAGIRWPMGVPHKGCGRTFATEKRRDLHERGEGWNEVVFPNGCLDRILPAELRDSR